MSWKNGNADDFELAENSDVANKQQTSGWENYEENVWAQYTYQKQESATEKFVRVFKHQPLVPLGALATTGFLVGGLHSLVTGNRQRSQQMMRGRVLAQGGTLGLLAFGLWWKEYQVNKAKEEGKIVLPPPLPSSSDY